MERWAWQGLFAVYGALGILLCMICIPVLSEDPPIRQNQYFHGEPLKGVGDVPWEKFVRSPAVWAIFIAQCTQGAICSVYNICNDMLGIMQVTSLK